MWHRKKYLLLFFMIISGTGDKISAADDYKKYQHKYQNQYDDLVKNLHTTSLQTEQIYEKLNSNIPDATKQQLRALLDELGNKERDLDRKRFIMRYKIQGITLQKIILDRVSITELNKIMPKGYLLEYGMTIGDAVTFIIQSELVPMVKEFFINNFFNIISPEIKQETQEFYQRDIMQIAMPKILSELFDTIQEKIDDEKAEQEARDLKRAQKDIKKARSKRDEQIESFLNEPLDENGEHEYNSKFYNDSNIKVISKKTKVKELLHHIASSHNARYDAGESIVRNMSVHLPSAVKRDIYFGGQNPIITKDVINERLAQIRKEYKAAPDEAVAREH